MQGMQFALGEEVPQPRARFARARRSRLRPLGIALVLLIGAVFYAITDAGRPPMPSTDILATLDRVLVRAGLGIEQVSIHGHRYTADEDIWEAAWIAEPQSLIRYDIFAAENRIRALPWIASARIVRQPPNGLDIMVTERVPFAVWRREGPLKAAAVGVARAHLIDAAGRILAPIGNGRADHLPVVSGDGAATEAAALLSLLDQYPQVRGRLESATRVANQRWTLRLLDGLDVLLPTKDVPHALDRLTALAAHDRLFERDLVLIDLRFEGGVSVRPVQRLSRPHKPEQRPVRTLSGRSSERGKDAG